MDDEPQYAWRPDRWAPPGLDADVAGRALARIREKRGELTAEVIAEEAKAKRSPLHNAVYHVEAAKAAELYYLERARKIVQAIVLVTTEPTDPVVRAFQFVVVGDGSQYVPTSEVALDEVLREQVVAKLLAKILALRNQLAAFQEFAAVVAALNEALAA